MIPKREAILEKAMEIFMQEQYKNGMESVATPEPQELIEGGYTATAKSLLMCSDATKYELDQWKSYIGKTEKRKENLAEKEIETETIPFSVSEAMQSGFFISGTRQMSGKTNLAKCLAWKLMCEGITVYVLDVSQAWLHDTPIGKHMRIPNGKGMLQFERYSTVFDMSTLMLAERIAFANNFSKAIYESHVKEKTYPELIIYEESQSYLYNGAFRSLRKYSSVVDFVTTGGNFDTSFGLITQFPAMIDKNPVKAAQQRYFGLTTEYNDVQYVKSFIGKERIAELKNLQLGEFLYQNKGKIERFQCGKYGTISKGSNGFNYQYAMVTV